MLSYKVIIRPLEKLLVFSILFMLLTGALTQVHANQSKSFMLHPSWYNIKHKAENDPMFYGKPMYIKKIEHTGKRWKCGDKYCYSYRIVINRPSRDKGDGVIWYGTSPFKIEYWVGEAYSLQSDVLAALTGGYDISQLQEKRREIILSFNKAFLPGKYYLKIAPFPYPSLHGSSLAKYVGYYRHDLYSLYEAADDYFGLAKELKNVMSGLIFGKIQDVAIDTLLIKVANKYGIYLVLEIPAVMPNILGKDVKQAHSELLNSSLRPEPRNWKCTKTRDSSLYGKVFKTQYKAGKLLNLNQRVIYDYYCFPNPVPNIRGMYTKDADQVLRKSGFRPAPGKCIPTQNKKLHNKVFRYALKADLNERVAYKYYCFKEIIPKQECKFCGIYKTTFIGTKIDSAGNKKSRKLTRYYSVKKSNKSIIITRYYDKNLHSKVWSVKKPFTGGTTFSYTRYSNNNIVKAKVGNKAFKGTQLNGYKKSSGRFVEKERFSINGYKIE